MPLPGLDLSDAEYQSVTHAVLREAQRQDRALAPAELVHRINAALSWATSANANAVLFALVVFGVLDIGMNDRAELTFVPSPEFEGTRVPALSEQHPFGATPASSHRKVERHA